MSNSIDRIVPDRPGPWPRALALVALGSALYASPVGATPHAATTARAIEGAALDAISMPAGPLPLLRLGAAPADASFVRDIVAGQPAISQARSDSGMTLFREGARLAAFVGNDAADSEVFPNLERLPVGVYPRPAAMRAAAATFARTDVIPRDDTTLTLAAPSLLYRGFAGSSAGARHSPPVPILEYVAANRLVGGLPVLGPGSRASLGIAADGSIRAFVKHWRAARRVGFVTPTHSAAVVRSLIVSELQTLSSISSRVVVDRVGLGYYDGNGSYLQPVYYFTARVFPVGAALVGARDGEAVVGYIPFGATVESIPDLSAPRSPAAMRPAARNASSGGNKVTVGAYIVRDADPGFTANAQEFTSGLEFGSGAVPPIVPGRFALSQFYPAYPYQYLGFANSYVNSVQLADTEAHGDWWLFTTYSDYGDLVFLQNIGTGGNPAFGGAGPGSLAHWMIHACSVIPAMFDLQIATGNYWNAFNPWWNIFNGLHEAVGYRTIAFIDDDTGRPYGMLLGLGAATTPAWFNTLASANLYTKGWTYQSTHLGRQVPFGEPSAISIPGLQNESVYSVAPASPAWKTGLYNFYLVGAVD